MIANKLSTLTLKDLGQLAKKRGVNGWHSMRKEQLLKALANGKSAPRTASPATRVAAVSRSAAARTTTSRPAKNASTNVRTANGRSKVPVTRSLRSAKPPVPAPKAKPKDVGVLRRLNQAKAAHHRNKDLALRTLSGKEANVKKDRLVVMVRDSYWLHAYWELSRAVVERAEAALGQDWHSAKPVLRLLDVSNHHSNSAAETVLRHIDIHGGVNNWYVDVQDPPRSYRLEIGYLSAGGKFYALARSNIVTTPKPGSADAIDENWSTVAKNFDKIYALSGGYSPEGPSTELQELFEERLRRPMGSPMMTRYGAGAEAVVNGHRKREFAFELDAELIIYGSTECAAHVMLQGEPVQLRPDGTFTVRLSLPNCRQVIPAVASSPDGMEQRTIVLAVERNTKVMEPVVRDSND